ncbi:urease accessory protein UreE [Geitlerinema splendidum]|nr:urease accessory protein UreE [Geitlerinema splendidum]
MELTLIQRLPANPEAKVSFSLSLTARERSRSRYSFETPEGNAVLLRLPRGTVLADGDLLQATDGETLVRVVAKAEPVLHVTPQTPLDLLKAAYHLGNRHVPVEIHLTYLRLEPDPVLKGLLEQLGLEVSEEVFPFQPEAGAYSHNSHSHDH